LDYWIVSKVTEIYRGLLLTKRGHNLLPEGLIGVP